MNMETAKNIFLIIQAAVGIGFSIFMMWGMFKVKKGADKISNSAKDMVDQFENFSAIIPTLLSRNNNQMIEPPCNHEFHLNEKYNRQYCIKCGILENND